VLLALYVMNAIDNLQRLKIIFLFMTSISLGLVLLVNLFYPLSSSGPEGVTIVGSGYMYLDVIFILYFAWLASSVFNCVYGFNISGSGITFFTGLSGKKTFNFLEATSVSLKGPFHHYKFVFGGKSLYASASLKGIDRAVSAIQQKNPSLKENGRGV
jgi:hypothetical protein